MATLSWLALLIDTVKKDGLASIFIIFNNKIFPKLHPVLYQIADVAHGIWNFDMPFNGATYHNDYVILKLASDLTFGDHIQPACLPEASYDPVGEKCFVSGWGTLYSGAFSLPETLQWVDVPIITNSDCDAAYTTYDITDSMICAAYPEGGKDACQGDSGGPLVCEVDGDAIITGVVSWGIGCADADHPGVYSRVTEVLSWIESNMVIYDIPLNKEK